MSRAHRSSPIKSLKHIGAHTPHSTRHTSSAPSPKTRATNNGSLVAPHVLHKLMPDHALGVLALSASDRVERTGAWHLRKEGGAKLRQAGLVG
jgi:hypothetical protein